MNAILYVVCVIGIAAHTCYIYKRIKDAERIIHLQMETIRNQSLRIGALMRELDEARKEK